MTSSYDSLEGTSGSCMSNVSTDPDACGVNCQAICRPTTAPMLSLTSPPHVPSIKTVLLLYIANRFYASAPDTGNTSGCDLSTCLDGPDASCNLAFYAFSAQRP